MQAVEWKQPVFLKNETKLEPLALRWYAWSHLISPAQHALNIAFRHVPMLESFVAAPEVHEVASRSPRMLGGPYLELKKSDLAQVRALLADTLDRGAGMIRFAHELLSMDRQLQADARGFSLDYVYQQLPQSLAGLVEVTYDSNNHPSIRINEELAQQDGLSNAWTQEISFSTLRDERRNFFLNTPRLQTADRMIVPLPFADQRFDLLAASRIQATPFAQLAQSLGIERDLWTRFRDFFTTDAPRRNAPEFPSEGVRVRYFGHACILLQTSHVCILIDPFVTWDHAEAPGHLSFADLPDCIDFVFLTHNHQDHFSPEVLLQLRNRIGRILVPRNNPNHSADASMKLALRQLGFSNVDVLDPLDSIAVADGRLTSLPFYGEHSDLTINSKQGLHVQLKGRTFLLLADSDCKDRILYRRLARLLGKVDTVFIGMECHGAPLSWLYGPYLAGPISPRDDDSRRLSGSNAAHAWAIIEEFGGKQAFVYAMGQEPWMKFVSGLQYTAESAQIIQSDEFVARCRAAGLTSERLYGCRTMVF
jgi:L-ascorbate metabolism protein UlaG (beta-lactamase superfamily)